MKPPLTRAATLAATVAATLATALPAARVSADHSVTVHINAVLASNAKTNKGIDPALHTIRNELKRLPFKSYHLLERETRMVRSGDECGLELPGNRYLHVMTRENASDHLKMTILLNQANRPILTTEVKIDYDSVVLLGGPRDAAGTLLIAIGANTPEQHGDPADADAVESDVRSAVVQP